MQSSKKIFFPNLDALRFFAFLSVFISHCAVFITFNAEWFLPIKRIFLIHGDLGVNFFFVLSGFLISFLLLTENRETNKISLKHFYIRRILRIWPLYFITLFVGFFILTNTLLPFLQTSGYFDLTTSINKLPWYLFFLANIDLAYFIAPSVIIGVLWSISIEEQFYLLWPLAIKKINLKYIPAFLLTVIIASYIFRYSHISEYNIVKYHTFSVFSDLAIGCLAGYYTFFNEKFKKFFTKLSKRISISIYAILIALIPLRTLNQTEWLQAIEPLIFSIFFTLIILEQIYSEKSLFKVGKNKVFTWLGKISYGLYCYHMIAMVLILAIVSKFNLIQTMTIDRFLITSILVLFLTILIAGISYRFIEKPLLRLKGRF